ncbi:VOC family protein [Granulicella tundricola]|uniref:3-demethylubiquinone-9 3-methyltransferase n=1 Tax=Granulicella tundricola (strain ATCC BAA-1859 / DSM 23138 / MP5ACTX9) TaxID=1198114 RepID=E8X696_GRATM|nr:VOC family protein [Granulicella tundricola]ADW70980.1 3-demethylubiquinone-9 3-methyltransferase [Granulicella tundricola MP5ACTX9]
MTLQPQKVSPFLWFNDQAEEAMDFYTSTFPDSKQLRVARYGETGPGKPGSVMTADFELFGQRFTALNGGPHFAFTPAISFVIHCEGQAEIDEYWDKLAAGGTIMQCGWLTDKFGITWQVVPNNLAQLLSNPDPATAARVMKAMMSMKKLEIAPLEQARDQTV